MLIIKNIILILTIAYLFWASKEYGGDAPGTYYAIIVIIMYIVTKPILLKLGII